METQGEQTMEERTVLTEKEMGIEMWERIKERIRYNHPKHIPVNVTLLKYEYLKEKDMVGRWIHMCILCQKHDDVCLRCPLRSCSIAYKTLWAVVVGEEFDCTTDTHIAHFTLEERLEACDKIIEAIKNDVPDDYKS